MYTVDYNLDVPVMLINRQIGQSYNEDGYPDGNPYIDGAYFQEELMRLDSLGKKSIQVWICSEGGSVIDAMKICTAILKCKTPVDTVNTGVCASSTGMIFMCGRKRTMMDYATFMAHPVSGSDDKAKEALTKCIADLASANANFNSAVFEGMMSETTWLDAEKCLEMGICTQIECTNQQNKKYLPSSSNIMARLEYCNKLTDDKISQISNNNKMDLKQITNKLNLVDGADLSVINNAIDALIKAKNQAETEVSTLNDQLATAKAELESATAKVIDLQTAVDAAEAAAKAAEEAKVEVQATDMVNKYAAKIGNNAEAIAKMVNLAKVDFEGTKTLLEAMTITATGNRIPTGEDTTNTVNVQNIMYTIAKNNKQN